MTAKVLLNPLPCMLHWRWRVDMGQPAAATLLVLADAILRLPRPRCWCVPTPACDGQDARKGRERAGICATRGNSRACNCEPVLAGLP